MVGHRQIKLAEGIVYDPNPLESHEFPQVLHCIGCWFLPLGAVLIRSVRCHYDSVEINTNMARNLLRIVGAMCFLPLVAVSLVFTVDCNEPFWLTSRDGSIPLQSSDVHKNPWQVVLQAKSRWSKNHHRRCIFEYDFHMLWMQSGEA